MNIIFNIIKMIQKEILANLDTISKTVEMARLYGVDFNSVVKIF